MRSAAHSEGVRLNSLRAMNSSGKSKHADLEVDLEIIYSLAATRGSGGTSGAVGTGGRDSPEPLVFSSPE